MVAFLVNRMRTVFQTVYKSLVFFVFIASFFLFPSMSLAETTPYRTAGWVDSVGDPSYTNLDKCQKTDGEYCNRTGETKKGATLYFGWLVI